MKKRESLACASHHRRDAHSWFPQAGQPAAGRRDRTCLCRTAACSPPDKQPQSPSAHRLSLQETPSPPSAYLIRLELLSDDPDVLLVLRMDVQLLLPVGQKHLAEQLWAGLHLGEGEGRLPAQQREEAGQEGDTDHNHKQHLVADAFNEGVLILDQVVPTVAVLHYLQT